MATVQDINAPDLAAPSVDWATVSFTGDGTAFNRSFRYVHRRHSQVDILKPGYFNPVPSGKRDQMVALQPWDEISFCVGGPDPFDASRGLLVIGKKPERPGDDVTVGLVYRDKTTVAGHDGKLAENKKDKAA